MARPKLDTVIEMPHQNDEADALIQREAQIRSVELETIVRDFGNGVPFSKEVYKDKIIRHLQRSAEELLEAGKALYVSYKHTEYGGWGLFLQDIGLEESLARRMIQAAKKFHRPEARPVLQAAGNKSKLFELLVLDDEDLVKVSQGAEDAPITLDEIDRMPTSELRKALREARADGEANKKVLEDKNHKLDKLQAELEKARNISKKEPIKANYDVLAVRTDLTERIFEFDLAVKRIGDVLATLKECDEDFAIQAQETFTKLRQQCEVMANGVGFNFLDSSRTAVWLPQDDDFDFDETEE